MNNHGGSSIPSGKSVVLIADFDGTLYRGSCPLLFRGIANVDLMMALCLLNLFKVKRLFRLLAGMVRLRRQERRLRRDYGLGKTTLSDADEQQVRFFAANILAHSERTDLDRAARMVSALCYRAAWRCLDGLKDRCEFVTISKSFEFVLAQVGKRAAGHGISLAYHGNKAGYGAAATVRKSVIRKEDKFLLTKALLTHRRYEKAIVIGDTEDDLAMRDAAVDVLGTSNVLFICMNAKDAKIAGAADHSVTSWNAAGALIERKFNDGFFGARKSP